MNNILKNNFGHIKNFYSLEDVFPDSGLFMSNSLLNYYIVSSISGSIAKHFDFMSFSNSIKPLSKLFEKEVLYLTEEEYIKVINHIKNITILK